MHVLLATEYADLRLSMELLLSEEPGVTIAGTASEAAGLLGLIGSTHPDIVILDWDLPGRSAPDLLAQASDLWGRARFIVLSALPDVREQARQAGAAAFVVKGDPPEQLLLAFRQTRKELMAVTEESESRKE
jgi:DNA-binding NarL/FixJ family response regulator